MRKSGQENFISNKSNLNFNLIEFWSWSQSDVLSNSLRGILAEFIVAKALDIPLTTRVEWDAFDLLTEDGLKIEIKSSAYLQTWKQEKLSKISFNIAPTLGWNAETNKYSSEIKRQADVYVFCLLHHQDKTTVNPMDMDQWSFYAVPTQTLNELYPTAKSIGINKLTKIAKAISYSDLKKCINE